MVHPARALFSLPGSAEHRDTQATSPIDAAGSPEHTQSTPVPTSIAGGAGLTAPTSTSKATAPSPPASAPVKTAPSPNGQYYSLEALREHGGDAIVDKAHKERYLSLQDFEKTFSMTRETFDALQGWKQSGSFMFPRVNALCLLCAEFSPPFT